MSHDGAWVKQRKLLCVYAGGREQIIISTTKVSGFGELRTIWYTLQACSIQHFETATLNFGYIKASHSAYTSNEKYGS